MNKHLSGNIIIPLLLSVLLVFSIVGCGQQGKNGEKPQTPNETTKTDKTEAKNPYKIGAILDITGAGSALGVSERDALKMLVEEKNAKGGINGHPIDLVIYDNESDEMKSVIGIKKLINEDKVAVIIGTSQSGTTMAMLDTATKAQIPLMSLASSSKVVEPVAERKWIFKSSLNDALIAEKIGQYLVGKNLKKVAVLRLNNALGDSTGSAFQKVAKAKGITILSEEKMGATDKDYTSQLTRIKAVNPDAVVALTMPQPGAILAKNYRQLKLEMPLIYNNSIGIKSFIDLTGDASNGIMFPAGKILVGEQLPDTDRQKKAIMDFVTPYESKYGPRTTFAGHASDGFHLLVLAMEKAGDDRAKIRDELENTKNFAGVHGLFNLSPEDHVGLRMEDLAFIRIENGKWVIAK